MAAAFVLVAASATAGAVPPHIEVTRLGVSTIEFSCETKGAGDCHYLILHSLCQEKFIASGQKERTCTYSEAVPPFSIKSGERKKVGDLASDFLFTMKLGSAPTVADVLRAPLRR